MSQLIHRSKTCYNSEGFLNSGLHLLKNVFIVVIMKWSTFTGFPCPSFSIHKYFELRNVSCIVHENLSKQPDYFIKETCRNLFLFCVEVLSIYVSLVFYLCLKNSIKWLQLQTPMFRLKFTHADIFFTMKQRNSSMYHMHKYFLFWKGELPVSLLYVSVKYVQYGWFYLFLGHNRKNTSNNYDE